MCESDIGGQSVRNLTSSQNKIKNQKYHKR